jgi:hypothetical protein
MSPALAPEVDVSSVPILMCGGALRAGVVVAIALASLSV